MEVTKENLKCAYEHMKKEWDFYWEQSKGNPRWKCNLPREIQEGDMVYVQLDVGFPCEMCFGHWCYIVKDIPGKLLVIPSTSVKDSCPAPTEMDISVIIHGKKQNPD